MNSEPSARKSRSNSTRFLSNASPDGRFSGSSSAGLATRYAPMSPARMLTRVRPMAWSWYQRLPGGCRLGYAKGGEEKCGPVAAKPEVNQASEWPSEEECCTPPWRWTTVGTPRPGVAVARVGSHGRKWRAGRWLVHVTCVGTPCMASIVGPGTVAASLLAPKAKTRVAGRSRWNFQVVSYMPMVRLPATSPPPSATPYPRSLGMSGSSSTNFSSPLGSRRPPPPTLSSPQPSTTACNTNAATASKHAPTDLRLLSLIAATPSNLTDGVEEEEERREQIGGQGRWRRAQTLLLLLAQMFVSWFLVLVLFSGVIGERKI
uniref:Uncharacterized protein n=1 Tax=Arundo donax TaxID=35708 RepID=A0A0A9EWE5_ARUDO